MNSCFINTSLIVLGLMTYITAQYTETGFSKVDHPYLVRILSWPVVRVKGGARGDARKNMALAGLWAQETYMVLSNSRRRCSASISSGVVGFGPGPPAPVRGLRSPGRGLVGIAPRMAGHVLVIVSQEMDQQARDIPHLLSAHSADQMDFLGDFLRRKIRQDGSNVLGGDVCTRGGHDRCLDLLGRCLLVKLRGMGLCPPA